MQVQGTSGSLFLRIDVGKTAEEATCPSLWFSPNIQVSLGCSTKQVPKSVWPFPHATAYASFDRFGNLQGCTYRNQNERPVHVYSQDVMMGSYSIRHRNVCVTLPQYVDPPLKMDRLLVRSGPTIHAARKHITDTTPTRKQITKMIKNAHEHPEIDAS